MGPTLSPFRHTPRHLLFVIGVLATAACGKAKSNADAGASTGATAGATIAATADSGMAGMASMDHSRVGAMTGNTDQDFLRMMSNQQKGLIAMAHMMKDGKESTAAMRADARMLDSTQDAELDSMTTMLETSFKDPYQPMMMPKHQAMADALGMQHGTAYARAFYQDVIAHHRESITMMDEYLPKLTRPELKSMVQRMRERKAHQITEFQQKMSAIK